MFGRRDLQRDLRQLADSEARITQADRQRLLRDLGGTGSLRRSIKLDQAPVTIKQFLRGEVDLDTELSRRFANAPVLTSISRYPEDTQPASRATSSMISQDSAASFTIDLYEDQDLLEATFTLNSMIAQRFHLPEIGSYDKRRWIELMRREGGVAFLWTSQRWDSDYMIFVIRPHFMRLYAFSPHRFEASVRLSHNVARLLINWLEIRWF